MQIAIHSAVTRGAGGIILARPALKTFLTIGKLVIPFIQMSEGKLQFPAVNRTALSAQVAEQLEQMIASGQLRVGDRLPPERGLTEEMGVARPVLREAIRMLSERGLLKSRQGSGTTVQELQPQVVRKQLERSYRFLSVPDPEVKIYELRSCLEPAIAGLVAQRAKPSAIEILQDLAEAMARHSDDRPRFVEADRQFHLTMVDLSGNELFRMLLEPVHVVLKQYMIRTLENADPGRLLKLARRHREIVKALRMRDAQAATQAMERHFRRDHAHDAAEGKKT